MRDIQHTGVQDNEVALEPWSTLSVGTEPDISSPLTSSLPKTSLVSQALPQTPSEKVANWPYSTER